MVAIMVVPVTVIYFELHHFEIQPLNAQEIKDLSVQHKAVVIYPLFTQNAYKPQGFYFFYKKTCGIKCLNLHLDYKIKPIFNSGRNGYLYLKQLNYSIITDIDVDKNPSILKNYDTIILLHNEYVTQTEYNAISNFSHVIYLYPNTLYALIATNYTDDTMKLIRGHGYQNVSSAFSDYDDHTAEYDTNCDDWKFEPVHNGYQLNCYPELLIAHDRELLKELKNK